MKGTAALRIRHLLLLALAVAFVCFAFSRLTEVEVLVATLRRGDWRWVLAAGVLQMLYCAVYAALYQSAFATAGVHVRSRDLLAPEFEAFVVNIAAPSGGTALFIAAATRRGQSPARAAAGAIIVRVVDFGVLAILLVAALVHLAQIHDLKPYETVAALVLIASTTSLAGVLLLGLWRPSILTSFLISIERIVNRTANRLGFRGPLGSGWAQLHATEFTEAAVAVSHNPAGLLRTVIVAVGLYVVDLASLQALFLAFHGFVPFGALVAGFSVGVLFSVVSITPQGIGVVEGMMPIVFAQLGVPGGRATVVSLIFRGLTFWLPLLVGFLLLERPSNWRRETRGRTTALGVHLVAGLTALMGIVNVLSAVTPGLRDRVSVLSAAMPLIVRQGAHLTAAVAGFALLLLAQGLWRRKRVAWELTLATLAISAVSHMVKGLDYEETLLAGSLGIGLLLLRPRFAARSDPSSVQRALRNVVAAALFTLAYGVAGFYLLDRHFQVDFDLWEATRQTAVMFVEIRDPGLEPVTAFGRYFADSIYLVGILTVGTTLLMVLRPVLLHAGAGREERDRAEAIVRKNGRSSLARFALLDDKSYFFSPGGSVIAYTVKGRVALALGDPIGPESDVLSAVREFQSFCAPSDWLPAFYQTLPDHLEVYRSTGLSSLAIGVEAIVNLGSFSLEGGGNKSLRNAVNRLTRLGYRSELLEPPLDDDALEELRSVSDEWLATMRGAEKGFSLGWFCDEYIRGSRVMVIKDAAGDIQAFCNIVPEYQLNEVSIDLMRRRSDAEGGTMDYLFTSLLRWAHDQGYASFNLGLSPLAGVGASSGDPLTERAVHFIYEHVNQFYNFKGLQAFKEKFHPDWSPRYLIYPGVASLQAAVLAVIRADSGDGFLWDHIKGIVASRFTRRLDQAEQERR